MNAEKVYRWAVLAAIIGVVTGCGDRNSNARSDSVGDSEPYILTKDEGEILTDRQGRTTRVKVSPKTGSRYLAMGTQEFPAGSSTLIHKHDHTEEILYITEGSGTLVLGDERFTIQPDTTVWVPPGTWHGVEKVDSNMHVLWIVTPPGLENFFRKMFWLPGYEPKQLTPQEIAEIEQQHDSIARP